MPPIREIMLCTPGKPRPTVDTFLATAKLDEMPVPGKTRVVTGDRDLVA